MWGRAPSPVQRSAATRPYTTHLSFQGEKLTRPRFCWRGRGLIRPCRAKLGCLLRSSDFRSPSSGRTPLAPRLDGHAVVGQFRCESAPSYTFFLNWHSRTRRMNFRGAQPTAGCYSAANHFENLRSQIVISSLESALQYLSLIHI